jgi:hypothetical protein
MLRCPPDKNVASLLRLADEANSHYYVAGRKRKPDGSERILLDARYPLKTIHGRIQAMILKKVEFPEYLQGGIKKVARGRTLLIIPAADCLLLKMLRISFQPQHQKLSLRSGTVFFDSLPKWRSV